jgi:hypothetical protein
MAAFVLSRKGLLMASDGTARGPAPRQKVYLLRLWETRSVPPDVPATWRFSLEDVRSNTRHGFATLDALVSFLDQETTSSGG